MSALTPPTEVRITKDARLLFRSMLIEDEKHDIINSDHYLMLDKVLASDSVFWTQNSVIESLPLGSHFRLSVVCEKIGDPGASVVLRFPYYVRAEYLISAK